MQQEEPNKYVKELTQEKYKYGFTTEVHTDIICLLYTSPSPRDTR